LSQAIGTPAVVGDEVWYSDAFINAFFHTPITCGTASSHRIDLATGQTVGSADLPRTDVVAFGDNQVASNVWGTFGLSGGGCALGDGKLEVTDLGTGTTWTGAAGSRPIVVDDQIINSSGTTVRAYAAGGCGAATCQPVWTVELPTLVKTLAGDAGGRLYAITA